MTSVPSPVRPLASPSLGADVQLWSAPTGGGHRRVAEAVAEAVVRQGLGAVAAVVDDPLEVGALPHARALLGGYGPLVRTSPALWGGLFRAFSSPPALRSLELFVLSGVGSAVSRRTAQRGPRVVVNCHPLLGLASARAAASLSPPAALVTMVTDLTLVHPSWVAAPAALFLTPSAAATECCLRMGVPPSQVAEVGLPVDRRLSPAGWDGEGRASLRRRLGLDPDLVCLVVSGGGEGAGRLKPLLAALIGSRLAVQVVVLCGRNRPLLDWLRRLPAEPLVFARAYTEDPSPWLLAGDVYVGKAGPSALCEAAAAGLAMVITGALPGQEEANEALLVGSGTALSVRTPASLLGVVARLCTPRSPLLAALKQASSAFARPQAAELAAARVLELL